MSILLKVSLLCISILALNGCIGLTVVGGAIGIVDSIEKNRRMDRIELRIDALEKSKDVAEHKPYVPSYHNMNLMTQHNTDLLGINYKGK
jgi:hypothetical protein